MWRADESQSCSANHSKSQKKRNSMVIITMRIVKKTLKSILSNHKNHANIVLTEPFANN
jgi:hypothetical protein